MKRTTNDNIKEMADLMVQMNIDSLKQEQERHKRELRDYVLFADSLGSDDHSFVEGILEDALTYLRRELHEMDEQRDNTRYGSTMDDGWYDWLSMVQGAVKETTHVLMLMRTLSDWSVHGELKAEVIE